MSDVNTVAGFSGADLAYRDVPRLRTQIEEIAALMADRKWRTLGEIEQATGHRSASISAQLRNMRKAEFGSHTVERRYVGSGLYKYRVHATLGSRFFNEGTD